MAEDMRLLSLMAVVMAVICCVIPNVFPVAEEIDYYILSVLCVIAGILAKIDARMGDKTNQDSPGLDDL